MAEVTGYLGIDNGTQGLSIVFTDDNLKVIATGEGTYDMVPDLGEGCYEQRAQDWDAAMVEAMKQVRTQVPNLCVLAIGISGQMHGEVLLDQNNQVLGPVRLWCDARNEQEGAELTEKFSVKVPKRMTIARFLWTIRNRPEIAKSTRHMTTPAGYLSFRLTGQWTLGVGDASGMFPVDQTTMAYDQSMIEMFDSLVKQETDNIAPLESVLPKICVAGQPAGYLSPEGCKLLGLPEGIPVAPAEGDQPAALAGSLISRAGTVSCSFGTSVCANSVGDRAFSGVSPAVDQYCAADGKPINMVWLRNGTTFMNSVVESYGDILAGDKRAEAFATLMPKLVEADIDCGGLLALPFMDDEPGLNVSQGGTAMLMGWTPKSSKPGNVAKIALISTMFNLKKGSQVLGDQGYPRTELVLTGGLAKTPECGQILADVFNTPVSLLQSSDEGSSWGVCVLAKFLDLKFRGTLKDGETWDSFVDSLHTENSQKRYEPIPGNVKVYSDMYARYKMLLDLVPQLTQIMSTKGIQS